MEYRFPIMMLMRQCCVYPKLAVRYFRKKFKKECRRLKVKESFGDISHSKISAVVNKIVENKDNNKKKLVFCLFIKEMEKLKKEIEKQGISAEMVCGSTTKKAAETETECPGK